VKQFQSIKKIYIDQAVEDGPVAQSVIHSNSGIPFEITDRPREIMEEYMKRGPILEKDALLVYKYPGKFMSACPGSDGMVCCNYIVINFGLNCLFDCHYCYLQSFLNNPLMSIFGNIEDLFAEIDFKTRNKKARFRIGTGEYTDSLALDYLTGYSTFLVEHFAGMENAVLELKTKSSNVNRLLNLDHRGHTVVAWSVNPESIVESVEGGTATLTERLDAARRVADAGYRLAFHLDPVIYFEGWEEAYHSLIERIFDTVSPDRVAWISLGSFRYSPGLKEIVQARFPEDDLTKAEMIQGPDGKYRYFKTIREQMYVSIRKKIETVDPRLFLYLCMETQRMWEKVFQFVPESGKNLDALFEKRRQFIESIVPASR